MDPQSISLSQLVRTYPVTSKVYKEYSELVGKAAMLSELEFTLRYMADGYSNSLVRDLAPELSILEVIKNLRKQVDNLLGRPLDHRLGSE